jgi:hypothetical protein
VYRCTDANGVRFAGWFFPGIIASRGQAYHATGLSEKARSDFTCAIELDPEIAFMTATSVEVITADDSPGSVDPRTDD